MRKIGLILLVGVLILALTCCSSPLSPEQVERYLAEGAACMEAENYTGAVDIYTVLLQDDPENTTVRFHLFDCYLALGELEQAEQQLELLRELLEDPDSISIDDQPSG